MFTLLHILCDCNRITWRQMLICRIPSFQFEDFLFFPLLPYIKEEEEEKKLSVFLSPRRFDYGSPSGLGADLCEEPDNTRRGLHACMREDGRNNKNNAAQRNPRRFHYPPKTLCDHYFMASHI